MSFLYITFLSLTALLGYGMTYPLAIFILSVQQPETETFQPMMISILPAFLYPYNSHSLGPVTVRFL